MQHISFPNVILTFLLGTLAHGSIAGDWNRFRGPDATGVAANHDNLPLSWTTTRNVKWVTDVPGWGWSNPIVSGDKVFLTTVVSDKPIQIPNKGLYLGQGVREPAKGVHQWLVYCFDLKSGDVLWKHQAHAGQPSVPRHPKSTYASETPTTDGQRLYVLFGDLGLYCYDFHGKKVWSHPIEPKKTFQDYGAAASPVVHDGQVFIVYDNLEDSFIASFDAVSGQQLWKRKRNEKRSWATPLVWQNTLRTEVVVPGLNRNRSYSLDGQLLWEFDGRMSSLVIPSPFTAHGLCYIASGYVGDNHRPTFAIKPGAHGDITPQDTFDTSDFIAWYDGTSSSYNPSQIVYGEYLYTLYDRGFFTCHHATTGQEIYGKQRFSPNGSFTASPWAYNNHLFCLSEDGCTYVIKPGPEFEIIGLNDLDELSLACPAVADENLLIRTATKLYCLTQGVNLDPAKAATIQPRAKASEYRDIFTAVREGKPAEVKRMLDAGISVNERQGRNGQTPLSVAAIYGKTAVARLLLERGADTTLANQDGNTALFIAAFFCHQDLVKLLLQHGASPLKQNKRGQTSIDVVSSPWTDVLAGTYRSIGQKTGQTLDLEQIRQTRPTILSLLEEQSQERTTKEHTSH